MKRRAFLSGAASVLAIPSFAPAPQTDRTYPPWCSDPGGLPPSNPADDWKETDAAARSIGVEVVPIEARDSGDIEAAFAKMIGERVHGVVVTADAKYVSERTRISARALRTGVPTMFWRREFAEVGGLMTYGTDVPHLYRRAATYVDKILKGANPADLPIEQPTKFELVINVKTAKALGLTIPPSLLIRADQVIE
jgi:putative ABC transport system substrate-binding protein